MILYFKDLLNKLKLVSLGKKILFGILLFLYLIIVSFSLIKVDYSVVTPGTPSRVDSLITVETDNEVGRIFTISVFEYRHVSLLHYLVALTSEDVATPDFHADEEVTNKLDNLQGEIMKEVSVNNAIVMAYAEANKFHENVSIDYEVEGYYIYQLEKTANSNLEVKDLITHIDGVKINNADDISDLIEGKDNIKMTVKRDSKVINLDIDSLGPSKLGIWLYNYPLYNIKSVTPVYEINANAMANSRGPSGGLMQALAIYNAITPTDITGSKSIMGTGTIDVDGNVGPIGGVAQKVYVAQNNGANVFFVPEGINYTDAKAAYDKIKNPKFDLIPVATFSDAIEYLESLGG